MIKLKSDDEGIEVVVGGGSEVVDEFTSGAAALFASFRAGLVNTPGSCRGEADAYFDYLLKQVVKDSDSILDDMLKKSSRKLKRARMKRGGI